MSCWCRDLNPKSSDPQPGFYIGYDILSPHINGKSFQHTNIFQLVHITYFLSYNDSIVISLTETPRVNSQKHILFFLRHNSPLGA
jgi:hypothetical protein